MWHFFEEMKMLLILVQNFKFKCWYHCTEVLSFKRKKIEVRSPGPSKRISAQRRLSIFLWKAVGTSTLENGDEYIFSCKQKSVVWLQNHPTPYVNYFGYHARIPQTSQYKTLFRYHPCSNTAFHPLNSTRTTTAHNNPGAVRWSPNRCIHHMDSTLSKYQFDIFQLER